MKEYVAASTDSAYKEFEALVAQQVGTYKGPIFTTDAIGLFARYLDGITEDRQHYNCKGCFRFLNNYGGLATISPLGEVVPLFWKGFGEWPVPFVQSVINMRQAVRKAKITGVFINDQLTWGTPKTGEWTHLCAFPDFKLPKGRLTAEQVMAEKKQDFGILKHALADYGLDVAKQAFRVLEADALERSEKVASIGEWFVALHEQIANLKGPRRDNLIWQAVALAPPGWCHIRSTMISTLLDDIKSGLGYEEIAARWKRKMHPLQYQRPTAPISGGQIKAGNKRIEELGAAGALARRFAKIEEVKAFWRPSQVEVPEIFKKILTGGPFDHLLPKSKEVKNIELPAQLMTWARFKDEILPGASKLELLAPSHGSYYGMVTAVNEGGTPLMQWDTEPRNPVSWFFVHNGSSASRWSLVGGMWVEVNALCWKPPHWYHPELFRHQSETVFMILQGCKPSEPQRGGSFFPENLRSEFREIRAAMEAYSNSALIVGHEEGTANGYALQNGMMFNVTVRVNGDRTFKLDRWS